MFISESIRKFMDAADGLEINFKLGKESELIIKGDFQAMVKIITSIVEKQDKIDDAKRNIQSLQSEISRIES